MPDQKTIVVIDDHSQSREQLSRILKEAGYLVVTVADGDSGFLTVLKENPDCVILDTMMQEMDGLEVCAKIRREESLKGIKLIVHSAKAYDYDRKRALNFGADGFIPKPIRDERKFTETLDDLINDDIVTTFWGVRGTLPVPGESSLRYGGNTSCVSVRIPGKPLVVFDAGSGIKNLGDFVLPRNGFHIDARIFISHPHWDHVNALPFFSPLYVPGNNVEICGPVNPDISVERMIYEQMSSIYFPITVNELGASITYKDLLQGNYNFDGVEVSTMLLRHPGNCLGYRLTYNGRSICYVTDNELFPEHLDLYSGEYTEQLVEFVRGADILVTDSTYTDEEYQRHIGWGHSSISEVAKLARDGLVKRLCLFHHDPGQSDYDIDRKLKKVESILKDEDIEVLAPAEGFKIKI